MSGSLLLPGVPSRGQGGERGGNNDVDTGMWSRKAMFGPSYWRTREEGACMQALGPPSHGTSLFQKLKGHTTRATVTNIKVQPPTLYRSWDLENEWQDQYRHGLLWV